MELTKQNLIINFVDFQFPCGSKLIKFCHVRFICLFLCFYYCQMELTMFKIIIALCVNDYFNMDVS